jgi:hypothetical protein
MPATYEDILAQINSMLGEEEKPTPTPAPAVEPVPDLLAGVAGVEFTAPPPPAELFAKPVAPEAEIPVPDKPVTNIMERTICISLRIARIGIKRKVASSRIEVTQEGDDAPAVQMSLSGEEVESKPDGAKPPRKNGDTDKKLLAVTKTLLDCDEYREIMSNDGEMRRYLTSMALPSPFRSGTYLVSTQAVAPVEERLNAFLAKRKELIAKFKAAYPYRVQETALRLGSLFNPLDYPAPDRIDNFFRCDWQYVTFGTPEALKEISSSIFDRERQKAEKRWAEAEVKIQQVLRANMAELIEHLRERLAGDEDGKPKRFQASTLNKVQEFLKTFSLRNVTDDAALERLVQQAEGLLNGVDADMLRSDDKLREKVRAGFVEIEGQLDGMITAKAQRQIVFEEVDGAE